MLLQEFHLTCKDFVRQEVVDSFTAGLNKVGRLKPNSCSYLAILLGGVHEDAFASSYCNEGGGDDLRPTVLSESVIAIWFWRHTLTTQSIAEKGSPPK